MYAIVRGGGIERYLVDLPFSFNGVMRLRSLTAGQQAAHGIIPVVDLTPPFDPQTWRLANKQPSFTLFPDRVEITRPIEALAVPSAGEVAISRAVAIEMANPITHRNQRDFFLAVIVALGGNPLEKNLDGTYKYPGPAKAVLVSAEIDAVMGR